MSGVGWADCSSGVSGDMLLGALVELDAVDVTALTAALGVAAKVTTSSTSRAGIRATRVEVRPDDDQPHRRLRDVLAVVDAADVPGEVQERSATVFERLARAEARAHGCDPQDVEFHEVGAVDAIVDVVGVCLGLTTLRLDRLVVSPIALGGGRTRSRHGVLPVPGPAVLELLADTPLLSHGGPVDRELATPTGVALLAEWAAECGPMPAMQVDRVGVGAGGHDLAEQPNVLRLVAGQPPGTATTEGWQLLEANVDDLDPRLWPVVIDRLLAAGAADAWVAPIVMKKGRPAHTVSALCDGTLVDSVRRVLFTESSTIGVRSTPVGKHALEREWMQVQVEGQTVRVKVARLDGDVVNVSPEFDDIARAAAASGRPVKWVLAAASAAVQSGLS